MHTIICPDYVNEYTSSVNDKHRYNTRASTNNLLFIPFFCTKSGHRTFHASGTRLWNSLDINSKSLTTLSNFRKHIYNCNLENNSKLGHFIIKKAFQ